MPLGAGARPPTEGEIRAAAALVRSLLDELEHVMPDATELAAPPSRARAELAEQLGEELARLGRRLLHVASVLGASPSAPASKPR